VRIYQPRQFYTATIRWIQVKNRQPPAIEPGVPESVSAEPARGLVGTIPAGLATGKVCGGAFRDPRVPGALARSLARNVVTLGVAVTDSGFLPVDDLGVPTGTAPR